MPRPKSFERAQALEHAMRLFWQHGYAETSIQGLSAATGLQPGSLYAEFGSKHGLFLVVIDHYFATILQDFFAILETPASAVGALRSCLVALTERGLQHPPGTGCLMTNTTTDPIVNDPAVSARIMRYVYQMDEALYKILVRAREQEEVRQDLDLHALAHFLVTVIVGNNVLIRTPLAQTFVPTSIEMVLALIVQ